MAKAIWGGKVIAESNDTVDIEGNQYFPPDSVTKNVLKSSSHTSICPWKGTAHYYHVEVDGMKNENAAWYYPEPKPAAAGIKGRIAFWKGVRVETGKNQKSRFTVSIAHALRTADDSLRNLILKHRPVVHHKMHMFQLPHILQRIT